MKTPDPLPAWYVKWREWRLQGSPRGRRPTDAPKRIPAWAWAKLRADGKPRVAGVNKQAMRLAWVECHGYYDPTQAQIGRLVQDAEKWHGWTNCVPMVGIDQNWPLSAYPELAGHEVWSAWRWEQITDWAQFTAKRGGYLWVSDGFEAGTGDVNKLIRNLDVMGAKGVFLQCGHATAEQSVALKGEGFDVQAWASCAQISQADLRASLDELKPSRFVGQVESLDERNALLSAVNARCFTMPWDTVIAGWGDFPAI